MTATPILFTIPNFITAGSGRALVNIIERLDRTRFRPCVAVSRKGGKIEAELEAMGVPVLEAPFTVPIRPYATLPRRAWSAAAAFRGQGFAIWHSFHYSDDYSEAMISRMAGTRAWVFTKKNMGWRGRAWKLRSLLATRIAAQNTDMMKSFFATPVFRRKARLIPRGVDTSRFRPDVPPRLGVRERYGLHGRVVAAVVAHLVKVKNHPALIEAAARVPGLTLLIAGKPLDKEYSDGLVAQVAKLGISDRVLFLGDVGDVAAFLAEVDISVSSGLQEGSPVALLEAMACGKACIATDVPGSRDVVVDGESCLVVPANDPAAMAAALTRLVSSAPLRDELGRAARARILAHYSIEREVADHIALYEEILG